MYSLLLLLGVVVCLSTAQDCQVKHRMCSKVLLDPENSCKRTLTKENCRPACGECTPQPGTEEDLKRCCANLGMQKGCQDQFCTYQFGSGFSNMIQMLLAIQDKCSPEDGGVALTCASNGLDRTSCCSQSGVRSNCLNMCKGIYDPATARTCMQQSGQAILTCLQTGEVTSKGSGGILNLLQGFGG